MAFELSDGVKGRGVLIHRVLAITEATKDAFHRGTGDPRSST